MKVILVLLLHFSSITSARVLIVSPSPSNCSRYHEPCHTLSEYAHNIEKYVTNETKFVFLHGNHYLDTKFRVSKISNLFLLGNDSSLPEISSRVVCNNSAAKLSINSVSQFFISTLEIISCVSFVVDTVENVTLKMLHIRNATLPQFYRSTALLEDMILDYAKSCVTGYNSSITFSGTTVIKNSVIEDRCMYFYESTLTLFPHSNVKFLSNIGMVEGLFTAYYSKIYLMLNANLQFIKNNMSGPVLWATSSAINLMINSSMSFIGNTAVFGSVTLEQSVVSLMSNASMVFRGNKAGSAGGLLLSNSTLNFSSHTSVEFTENVADGIGGAVYVLDFLPFLYCLPAEECSLSATHCFFQVPRNYSDIHMLFNNNSALVGSDIYGGMIDRCILDTHENLNPTDVFNNITESSRRLGVSSTPFQLCFCNETTNNCIYHAIPQDYEVFPGEAITFHVLSMGQRKGGSPAEIAAFYVHDLVTNKLQPINAITRLQCSTVNYTVVANTNFENAPAALLVDYCFGATTVIQHNMFSLTVKKCLPFFELGFGVCERASAIKQYTIDCNISEQSIARNGATWIGYNDKGYYIVHRYCPFEYCNSSTIYITANDTDKQCAKNRTGLLCGNCPSNYSLMLGTSNCGSCSNYPVFLFGFFAFAGVALVVLLLVLRLTVTQGTINGLIFYGNIFYANRLLEEDVKGLNFRFLNVFLAWLNLDFGIESCLYNGLNTYQHTWLQFLFPLYIWVLIGIVIISSRYSSWMTRRLGTNPVAVLATLVLLSYNKILQTVISVFSLTQLTYININSSESNYTTVWLYDASVSYKSTKLILLFAVASLVFVLFLLPYTLFLIFGQCLQAKSNLRMFSWMNRPAIKYFLDNYHAPYQTRHRYWTGLMLLARIVLVAPFIANISNDPKQYLLAICVLVLCIGSRGWMFGSPGIYKKAWVDLLNVSFMLNLAIVSAVILYCESVGSSEIVKMVIGYTSLGVAFMTFIGILIYHIHLQVKDTVFGRKFVEQCGCFNKKQTDEDSANLLDFSHREN